MYCGIVYAYMLEKILNAIYANATIKYAIRTINHMTSLSFPQLKQHLPAWPCLLSKPVRAREYPLAPQPRLTHNTLECLVLVGRDLVTEKHGARLNLIDISTCKKKTLT